MSHPAFGQGVTQSPMHEVHERSELVEHSVDAARKLVIVKFRHRITMRDIQRYAMLLKGDPRFRAGFSEIVDLTGVTEFDLGGNDFMKLADEVDPFAAEARRAFAARSSAQQHAARMHKILRVNRNIEIFSSLEAAERWVQS